MAPVTRTVCMEIKLTRRLGARSGLFGGTGAGDEDVDEPFGALLPAGTGDYKRGALALGRGNRNPWRNELPVSEFSVSTCVAAVSLFGTDDQWPTPPNVVGMRTLMPPAIPLTHTAWVEGAGGCGEHGGGLAPADAD